MGGNVYPAAVFVYGFVYVEHILKKNWRNINPGG
jgi:hypothetical protein